MMEMTAGYPGQSGPLPIKMMAISDVENAHRRNSNRHPPVSATFSAGHGSLYGSNADDKESSDASTCGKILIFLSWVMVFLTMPFSLLVCFKVVQEYERAVIFRLGRLMAGGAKGPGIFFILPCIDAYARVDLRTRTYDVPPQELSIIPIGFYFVFLSGGK
ncbi:hypothetical protein ACKWTF_004945 [Chironomus riparius]